MKAGYSSNKSVKENANFWGTEYKTNDKIRIKGFYASFKTKWEFNR